jgi:hypothetical protein
MRDVVAQTFDEGTFCRKIIRPDRLRKVVSDLKRDDSDRRSSLVAWNLFALERWAEVFLDSSYMPGSG